MNVCTVPAALPVDESQRSRPPRARLSCSCSRASVGVGVISLRPLAPWASALQGRGVPIYSINMRRKLLYPAGALRTWALMRALGPEVMVTFLFHASVLGAVVGRVAGRGADYHIRSQPAAGQFQLRTALPLGWPPAGCHYRKLPFRRPRASGPAYRSGRPVSRDPERHRGTGPGFPPRPERPQRKTLNPRRGSLK
jgi:hypothetical protein